MTSTTNTPAAHTPYSPPADVVEAARALLGSATRAEFADANALYMAYASVTGYRSAVTGSQLPVFDECPPLVQAGWLAASRLHRGLAGGVLHVGELSTSDDDRVDPFLLGIQEIASATRDLAEAATLAVRVDGDAVATIKALIGDSAAALHARVKHLAPEQPES